MSAANVCAAPSMVIAPLAGTAFPGCTGAGVLRRVYLPLLKGSLGTALLMTFVDVMKELPATLALRPFNVDTLAVQTYHFAKDERLSEAAVMAFVIVYLYFNTFLHLTATDKKHPILVLGDLTT